MSLSSDNLYHFTDELCKLKSILKNGIRVSYTLENFSFLKERIEIDFDRIYYIDSSVNDFKTTAEDDGERFKFAVPMACFCDIPLSLIKAHSNVYGRYAVGLKKDWGIRRGVSPINYVAKDSDMAAALQSFAALTGRVSDESEEYQYRNIFTKIIQMTKPYEGPYSRNGHEWQEYRFYDEREWRYIEKGDATKILSEAQLESREDRVVRLLKIDVDDVENIIVSRGEEKSQLKEWIQTNRETEKVPIKTVDEVVDNVEGAV